MKFVIAPDSFKESLTAPEVAAAGETGFREVFPEAKYVLLALARAAINVQTTARTIATCGKAGRMLKSWNRFTQRRNASQRHSTRQRLVIN